MITTPIDTLIDIGTTIGFLSFPAYLLYWIVYHVHLRAWRHLWRAFVAFLAWSIATIVFFLFPMAGCTGGGCAGRVFPFLGFAVLYACSSAAIIVRLHRFRVKNAV